MVITKQTRSNPLSGLGFALLVAAAMACGSSPEATARKMTTVPPTKARTTVQRPENTNTPTAELPSTDENAHAGVTPTRTQTPPTAAPPTATSVPPTQAPPTQAPPTAVPPTATSVPPTELPPTQVPPTAIPATAAPPPTEPPPTEPPPPTEVPEPAHDYLAPGVWRCPETLTDAAYAGSSGSDKFHFTSCRWVKKIAPENRICFASRDAALAYGYQPCGTCNP